MVHPNETVIDHTRGTGGGGMGGVVINQSINLSAGVAGTVRAEVMGLMPQIAEASKSAVADAVRRGGSYSNAFGR
jgi:hypothetical protein